MKPRVNPIMSGRPGAMASGRGTAAATPGHSSAAGSRGGGKKPADAGKTKALESELDALARHVRKGRLISSWTPRHVSHSLLARIAEANIEGGDIGIAISVVKATRRVDLDGQTVWLDQDLNHNENASGSGGRVFPAHDVDDTEVPGGTPGSSAGGEPPRWAPAEGTSSGSTFSEGTHAHHPQGGNDAAMPDRRGQQPAQGGGPRMAEQDVWPRAQGGPGGGRDQAGVSSPPGTVKGVVGGAPAAEVIAVMSKNFPGKAIKWVKDAKWTVEIVPLHDVDFDGEASWAAHHDTERVQEFVDKLNRGKRLKPAILVRVPGKHRLRIVDGHHRALAYRQLGKPIDAFVGAVPDGDDRWIATHSSQLHQGADSLNKNEKVSKASVNYREATDPKKRCDTCTMFRSPHGCTLVTGTIEPGDTCDRWYGTGSATKSHEPPVAAGLTVLAADTGRILMLQRALVDDDPAAGHWEFPGGCLENGETGLMGAVREWQEETGCLLPSGRLAGSWVTSDGVYQGFIYVIASEDEVDWNGDRDDVINPDDPDGDYFEALAWWEPDQLTNNLAVRPELLRDIVEVQRLVREARGE
jgi:8-oxo-dGTP pyrophosphatase MutT (NUDIX family)